ncbi:constitutive coactivator of PPAR-gamma-like protein 2 isoform X2 [Monodelphis domestica]|uniref:constitutive coactivator of PPAR-gamma-like protein 2 isoform X2 n=1 Tax=Monodelphis domestica TaxID=13616 RepID=UPI0024E1CB35|nr:constitutive coactivator of PPAR-gamma-like protein 2 isoform X2 [Monodelphis domestica]
MGVQSFQEFLEKRCPGAVVSVDLLKLARTMSRQRQQQQQQQQRRRRREDDDDEEDEKERRREDEDEEVRWWRRRRRRRRRRRQWRRQWVDDDEDEEAGLPGRRRRRRQRRHRRRRPEYPRAETPAGQPSSRESGFATWRRLRPELEPEEEEERGEEEEAAAVEAERGRGPRRGQGQTWHLPRRVRLSQPPRGLGFGTGAGARRRRPARAPRGARVLVDAASALPRLYGGYHLDWVCGGQWSSMLRYLAALCQACSAPSGGPLELVVMFPGGLGKERLPEWTRRCQTERQLAQLIVGHVGKRGTPPPRAWFLPPACLSHCVRLALLRFRVQVFQSLEDHHLEVVAFFQENGFHGLLAHDSEYALYNIPSYYSSHALRLSWNGKNLITHQFLMQEVAKQLGLKRMNFPLFAALLGNHILPDEDLAAFHWSLLGPEHPLASLKLRTNQLVLPPCDVVIKAVSAYVGSIKDPLNLDVVGKDVFKYSQSRTEDKIERFKKAVEYYSVATQVHTLPMGPSSLLAFGPHQFGVPPLPQEHVGAVSAGEPLFPCQVPLSFQPGSTSALFFPPHHLGEFVPFPEKPVKRYSPFSSWSLSYDSSTSTFQSPLTSKASMRSGSGSSTSSNHVSELLEHKTVGEDAYDDKGLHGLGQPVPIRNSDAILGSGEPHIPSLLSMATRNHMDITTPPLPSIAPEVLRIAEHRHRRGLMYPCIYHVLTKGEIKIPMCIEDECNPELPPAVILFRPARQYVYGILFSLAETQRRLEHLAIHRQLPVEIPPVLLKEWSSYKGKSPQTPELVPALIFREWTCPHLKKLWLGKAVEDKKRRMRAFLACMKSDTPGMLNPANVPAHLLLMCCVLRYMIQWQGGRLLHLHELDAFLAQAVSAQLYEPDQLQELKIEKLDVRGIQLAALFMSGVDTALFANDACGQPVPWEHCCPWIYFDGKLFQSKLIMARRERAALIELCDGQTEQVTKVEKMRQSILEGIQLHSQLQSPLVLPMRPPIVPPFYFPPAFTSTAPPGSGRTRAFAV